MRAENAAENLAVVRHVALNLLRSVKGSKVGIQGRRLEAGWSEEFRETTTTQRRRLSTVLDLPKGDAYGEWLAGQVPSREP